MSTLKELTEDTTDLQDFKKLAHLKAYTFFIFYLTEQAPTLSTLHKINLKMKEDKNNSSECKYGESEKSVQLLFYNLEQECARTQGLMTLKMVGAQSKSKIVAYCSEQQLLQLTLRAAQLGIDLNNIPIILTQLHPTSDLSIFSGWNHLENEPFQQREIITYQSLSKRWIQATQQKVDLWKLKLRLRQNGRLEKLQDTTFRQIETGREYQQLFISHLSMGHHVKLAKRYQQRRGPAQKTTTNRMIYGWERFKSFCCLGQSNMKTSTGVVSISFVDERGAQLEILKHLREYEGSEESEIEASRVVRSDKGIYSLLLANIDRFHGNKLEMNGKPGDGRLEVIIFQGVTRSRKIGSVGEMHLGVDSECIEMQVGQSILRVWGALDIRVSQASRVKVAMSRQVLEC